MGVSVSNLTGKRRAVIEEAIATAGTDVPHRGTRIPAFVIGVAVDTSDVTATLTYSPTESDEENMRLYSSVDNQVWRLIPIDGPVS